MKNIGKFIVAMCWLASFQVSASELSASLTPKLEVLKVKALDHLSSNLDSSDIGEQKSGQAVQVVAPGLDQVGDNLTIEEILESALDMKNSSQVIDYMDDVNKYYGIFGPVFSTFCCGCGTCD